MAYQVVSRFFDRASGRYVDPGQECPPLPAEDATRLVRARCLVEVPEPRTEPEGPSARTRKPRPARQEEPAPEKE